VFVLLNIDLFSIRKIHKDLSRHDCMTMNLKIRAARTFLSPQVCVTPKPMRVLKGFFGSAICLVTAETLGAEKEE